MLALQVLWGTNMGMGVSVKEWMRAGTRGKKKGKLTLFVAHFWPKYLLPMFENLILRMELLRANV
jgi:hypothetical protein